MRYRDLGKTGLRVSEIGLGGEWLERHNTEEVCAVIDACEKQGINILDCWMSEAISARQLRAEESDGSFRDISVRHGKTDNTSERVIYLRQILHLRIYSPECRQIILILA